MEIIKKYKVVLALVLVVILGVLFLFYRLYYHDVKALTDFSASYEQFDKAMADFSLSKTSDLESRTGDALTQLNAKATFRLSSLIKNDSQLMDQALVVGGFSRKELNSLRSYKGAIQSKNADLARLAKEYDDLASKRKAAYTRFQEFAGKI